MRFFIGSVDPSFQGGQATFSGRLASLFLPVPLRHLALSSVSCLYHRPEAYTAFDILLNHFVTLESSAVLPTALPPQTCLKA